MAMKRILIAADHMLVVRAVRLALRQTPGFRVVGFVDGRQNLSSRLTSEHPDVVLIDEMSDPEAALSRVREVALYAPNAVSLLLTADMRPEWLDAAFDSGATSVVSKTVHSGALGTLLQEIVHGSVVVHGPLRTTPAARMLDCPLTNRELEVLRFVAQGFTNSRIARELWVTEQTVKFHLSNTYRKIGVANRTEASRYAYMNHLMTPDEQLAS